MDKIELLIDFLGIGVPVKAINLKKRGGTRRYQPGLIPPYAITVKVIFYPCGCG